MFKQIMPICVACACLLAGVAHAEANEKLDLAALERSVLDSDAGLRALQARSGAASHRAEAADELPDPSLNLAAQNFPLDTLDLSQEPMTQVSLGLKQQFPNKEKRALRERIARSDADRMDAEQLLERMKLLREARGLWLKVYASNQRLSLLRERQRLLSQLMQTIEAAYATSQAGRGRLLDAKLKLSELKQQVAALTGEASAARQALTQWQDDAAILTWPDKLPEWLQKPPAEMSSDHPELAVIDSERRKSDLEVKLASADYRSDWALETRYGYREDRVDFISLGVTVDLPVFSRSRLAPQLEAAKLDDQAVEANRLDRQAELKSRWASLSAQADSLAEQSRLYENDILPEYTEQVSLAQAEMESGASGLEGLLERKLKRNQARRQWLDTRIALAEKNIELAYLSGREKP